MELHRRGREVVKSWFNYRKSNSSGRRTSPLDDINATTWPTEWNGELIDLLSVLSRLVELEPAQADLLNAILAKPVASYTDLASAGVTWPGPTPMTYSASPTTQRRIKAIRARAWTDSSASHSAAPEALDAPRGRATAVR